MFAPTPVNQHNFLYFIYYLPARQCTFLPSRDPGRRLNPMKSEVSLMYNNTTITEKINTRYNKAPDGRHKASTLVCVQWKIYTSPRTEYESREKIDG